MSSSPTLIINPTRGVEEEEMLAIDQGRSHTPPPRSRPSSRIEILLRDLVRSQADMARSQEESKQKLENLARAQSEQLAHITGRLSSLEVSRQGTPSTSPNPGRRGSPSSAETKRQRSTCLPLPETSSPYPKPKSEELSV